MNPILDRESITSAYREFIKTAAASSTLEEFISKTRQQSWRIIKERKLPTMLVNSSPYLFEVEHTPQGLHVSAVFTVLSSVARYTTQFVYSENLDKLTRYKIGGGRWETYKD